MSRRLNRKNSDSPPILIHEAITDVELPPRINGRVSKKSYDDEVTKSLIADTSQASNNRPKRDRNLKRKVDGIQEDVYDEGKEIFDATLKSDIRNVSFSVQLSDYSHDNSNNRNPLPVEYLDHNSLVNVALLRKDILAVADEAFLDGFLENRYTRVKHLVDFTGTTYRVAKIIDVVQCKSYEIDGNEIEVMLKVETFIGQTKIVSLEEVSDHPITQKEFVTWKSLYESEGIQFISAEDAYFAKEASENCRKFVESTPRGRSRPLKGRKSSVNSSSGSPLTLPSFVKRTSLLAGMYEDISDHSEGEKSSPSEDEEETPVSEKIEEEVEPVLMPNVATSRLPGKSKVWLSLNSEIEALKAGSHVALCTKYSQLEEQYKHRMKLANIARRDRLRSIELAFGFDRQHAANQFDDKREAYDSLLQDLLQKQRCIDIYGNLPSDPIGLAKEESITRNNRRKKAKIVVEVKPLNFKNLLTCATLGEIRSELSQIRNLIPSVSRSKAKESRETRIYVDNKVFHYLNKTVRKGDTIVLEENGISASFSVIEIGKFDLLCATSENVEVRVLIDAFKYGKYSILDVSSN